MSSLNNYLNELMERAENEGNEPSKDTQRKIYLEGVQDTLKHILEWIEEHKNNLEAPNGQIVTFVEVE